MSDFLIVTFYTEGTPYEAEAYKMRESAKALGYPVKVYCRENRFDWVANCAYKAEVCATAWCSQDLPIVWIDADAIVQQSLPFFEEFPYDFSAHFSNKQGHEQNRVRSGTLYFGRTPEVGEMLLRWVVLSQPATEWDQLYLWRAFHQMSGSVVHEQLPMSYIKRTGKDGMPDEDARILHTRASSRYKRKIDHSKRNPFHD